MLEAYYTPGGYGGVLYQQERADDASAKPKLVPVGCVSTTKLRKLNSDVEHTLAATLYCLQKFRDWIATSPEIVVKVPVAGVQQVFALRDAGARLNGLVAQIAQYPVLFKHDAKLAERVTAAVYLPDVDQ